MQLFALDIWIGSRSCVALGVGCGWLWLKSTNFAQGVALHKEQIISLSFWEVGCERLPYHRELDGVFSCLIILVFDHC